jgi:UDP-4-amino-4,6-dideoxy-N-acetyl-beta-L-altrosamine transaminase
VTRFLPYGRQAIDDDDIAAVVAALRDDYLTTGPRVAAFEQALGAAVGAPHVVAVSSGTAALHLAMLALDLRPDDAVVVPAITFVATANAVRLAGAEVLFADVDPDTGLMTAEHARAALARAGNLRPRAVVPVHLAGQVVAPRALRALAQEHGLAVVEDACHALGSRDADGNSVGACRHADMACFSFHPVKTVATGEGGAITLADGRRADRLRRLRSHGIERDPASFREPAAGPWVYEMPEVGLNYRLTDVASALGISQLAKLDRFVARRTALVARYDRALAPLAPRVRPLARLAGRPAWHLMVALIDFGAAGTDRARVMAGLTARGIGTQVHYIPVPRQPYYRARYGGVDLPGADRYYERALTLPLHPTMADEDVDRVVAALAEALDDR